MITQIQINGFRSLVDFDLRLRSGLNILVGPNGAGKTNIILFFEFLSSLFSTNLTEAVNRCGGAGSIFTKTIDSGQIKEIHAIINGRTISRFAKNEIRYVHYRYEFEICLSEEEDFVFYKNQKISVASSSIAKRPSKKQWDAVLSSSMESVERANTKLRIEKVDLRKTKNIVGHFAGTNTSRSQRIQQIQVFLERMNDAGLPIVLVSSRLIEELREVIADFQGGEALNIVPSVAKLHEDSATPPGINRDGAGLAATLYYLQRVGASRYRYQRQIRRRLISTRFVGGIRVPAKFSHRPSALRKINKYASLLNPEIIEIGVDKDHEENKLKIFVRMKNENGDLKLPFSLMSDGTIKWIALVTAIFTSENMFAIEEPENFIHPAMQQEILILMRGVTDQVRRNYFVLMTTHSETLLNAASPDEVIVVNMINGQSTAHRPDDPKLLASEINRSGFGLGFLYLTGALDA